MPLEHSMEPTSAGLRNGVRMVSRDGSELADLDCLQGLWTEEQYLRLAAGSNRLIEFTDGRLEFLPTVTRKHQAILGFLYRTLHPFIQQLGGALFLSGLGMLTRPGL